MTPPAAGTVTRGETSTDVGLAGVQCACYVLHSRYQSAAVQGCRQAARLGDAVADGAEQLSLVEEHVTATVGCSK